MWVDIHEVVEASRAQYGQALAQAQQACVELSEPLLVAGELLAAELAAVSPAPHSIHRPVVVDGGAAVASAVALGIHASLAQLLTEVDHHRTGIHERTHQHGSPSTACISGKEVACQALLVVVLQEVQHVLPDVIYLLPASGQALCRCLVARHSAQGIIEAHLVIQIVETATAHIFAI